MLATRKSIRHAAATTGISHLPTKSDIVTGKGVKLYPKNVSMRKRSAPAIRVVLDVDSPATSERRHAAKMIAEMDGDGSDVSTLCDTYGLKREDLGRLTGFSLRALADWAANKLPSQPAKRRLHEVRRLLDALAEVVHRESIPQWLHRSNAAFDGMTPLQVIEVGEMDRLWAMVYDLGSGDPG